VLGSIIRINRDTRFSPDKRPYKDHLDLWFWEGDRKAAASGFYARLTPEGLGVGVGAHGFSKERLTVYRDSVADLKAGARLLDAVRAVEEAGYPLRGEEYKRTPPGFDVNDPERERLLRFSALWAAFEEPDGPWLQTPEALDRPLAHWNKMLPLHRWIVSALS